MIVRSNVVGLDTAANRLHAYGPDDRMTFAFCPTKTKKQKEIWGNPDIRRAELSREFRSYLERIPDGCHIFCEEPLAQRNGKTTRMLALVCGALWQIAQEFDCYWHWVNISHWKKVVLGDGMGNADKGQIREFCIAELGMPPIEGEAFEDWYDARCLQEYGAIVLGELTV